VRKTVCVNITYPWADCRHTWPKICITSMRKFADFTFYILKCREGPGFIHLVMSAKFIWTFAYGSFSGNSYFAWSACVTLWSVNILSCQFQFSLRSSKKFFTLSRRIFNLVNANKLSTLLVGMLREICESLGLSVDNIKQSRKKPLIEQISQVVGECSCSRKWQQSDWTTRKSIERQNKRTLCLFKYQ